MRHIISILLENEPGALSRVVGLFSARGYNIETLTVAPTEDPSLSRMTIVTVGSEDVIEQITKHLNRLVEVVKVIDLTDGPHIERELMLIKVKAVGAARAANFAGAARGVGRRGKPAWPRRYRALPRRPPARDRRPGPCPRHPAPPLGGAR